MVGVGKLLGELRGDASFGVQDFTRDACGLRGVRCAACVCHGVRVDGSNRSQYIKEWSAVSSTCT